MRFQVPQFIDVEDKIFGPLTLKQFIYLAGGGGLSFLVYIFVNNLFIALIPIMVIMGISAALGFYKFNRRFPLITMVEYAFKYYLGNKLYIWKKEDKISYILATPLYLILFILQFLKYKNQFLNHFHFIIYS